MKEFKIVGMGVTLGESDLDTRVAWENQIKERLAISRVGCVRLWWRDGFGGFLGGVAVTIGKWCRLASKGELWPRAAMCRSQRVNLSHIW